MPTDHQETTDAQPLIRLGDGGQAPILSYNVPQPSEYTGRNYIELEFDDDIWSEAAYERSERDSVPTVTTTGTVTPIFEVAAFQEPEALFLQYYATVSEPVTFATDGGVTLDANAEGITLAADGGVNSRRDRITRRGGNRPASFGLSASERRELGDIVFEKGGLEALAETKPEAMPAVFNALSPTREADTADVEALAELAAETALGVNAIDGTSVTDPDNMEQPTAKRTKPAEPERGVVMTEASTSGDTVHPETTASFIVQDPAFSVLIDKYGAQSVAENLKDGWRIRENLTFAGDLRYDLIPPAEQEPRATPRLALVETYKLSNFLGDYGAGRTVQTFSLLPGEKHTISLKTYRMSEEKRKQTTSILDGYEEEVANEFGEQLHAENTQRDTSEENFSYHASATASAGWGWGSASVSGGVAGSTAATRESFAKNVASTTQKHAAKTSAKRNVEVNTASESTETKGEEKAVERQIENINLSRTLNFVFRQMNQEFISLLHLVDARLAFHNGDKRTYREFTLSELDTMLDELVHPDAYDTVRSAVWEALYFTFDYRGEHVPAIETYALQATDSSPLADVDGDDLLDPDTNEPPAYWRFLPRSSTYMRPASDTPGVESQPRAGPTVEGIIVNATTVSLATDGVIVEAILGQGEALDSYSQQLQTQTADSRKLSNALLRAELEKQELGRQIVASADGDAAERAAVYATVFSDPEGADEDTDEDEAPEPEPVTP